MVGPHRSKEGFRRRRFIAADHLPESQSGEREGTVGISMAMDALRPYARPAGWTHEDRQAALSAPLSPLHARLLRDRRPASLRQPRIKLWPARARLVPA